MNLSDRWLAWAADVNPNGGGSPHKSAETLRKAGVPLQQDWDFTSDIDTSEKFYRTPPPKLFEKAREFLNNFDFKHEYVRFSIEGLKDALKYSPLGVSVCAWYKGQDDIYFKPKELKDNHWCVLYGYDDTKKAWKIFDSYDNMKKLYSYEAEIEVVKRFYIEKLQTYTQPTEKKVLSIWGIIKEIFK